MKLRSLLLTAATLPALSACVYDAGYYDAGYGYGAPAYYNAYPRATYIEYNQSYSHRGGYRENYWAHDRNREDHWRRDNDHHDTPRPVAGPARAEYRDHTDGRGHHDDHDGDHDHDGHR